MNRFAEKSTEEFSNEERKGLSILIVEPSDPQQLTMRESLQELGYGTVSAVHDAHSATKKLNDRKFSHLILSMMTEDIAIADFLPQVLEENEGVIAVVTAEQPELDQVFDLLVHGARGFVVKPFTPESLDYALRIATKSSPIPTTILNAPDRNKTLVELLMNNLDRVAEALRNTHPSERTQEELSPLMASLANSVEVAITFAQGGEEAYLVKLEEELIARSNGPATKLGRLRQRLRAQRGKKVTGE